MAADPGDLTPVSTHRDVKPDNVLKTPAGPLLVDWDGAGPDHAEWELTWAALHFSDLGENRAAFNTVASPRPPPGDSSRTRRHAHTRVTGRPAHIPAPHGPPGRPPALTAWHHDDPALVLAGDPAG